MSALGPSVIQVRTQNPISRNHRRSRCIRVADADRTARARPFSGPPALPRGPNTAEDPCHTQVFIDCRPVNAFPISDEFPVGALFFGGIEQARIPHERDRYLPSV